MVERANSVVTSTWTHEEQSQALRVPEYKKKS